MTPPRKAWIAGMAIGVVVLGIVGWTVRSEQIVDDVEVSWADRPTCTGATVTSKPVDQGKSNDSSIDEVAAHTPMIVLAPSTHCTVAVKVENRSNATVRLGQVKAAWLGPGSGAPLVAPPGYPLNTMHTDPEDDFDTVVEYAGDLGAGDEVGIRVSFVARPSCSDPGVDLTYTNWPAIEVSALGRKHLVHADDDLRVTITRALSRSDC